MASERSKLQATFKSMDTEEWLDIHFTRPIGYVWALFFKRLHVHPNVVTIFSILLGMAAAVMFYFTDFWHNVAGVLLMMWANFYDSADGQLARMTGQKTHWGRLLDGFAGDIWFFCIYVAICLRLFHQPIPLTDIPWGIGIFALCIFSGTICHARQSQLADYYRNIHLYFLPGADSELDTYVQQKALRDATPKKGNFWWRIFLFFYVRYTRRQEELTPEFQRLMQTLREKCGGEPGEDFRQAFRQQSLPLMKYANILTFNCRAFTLYAACLLNIPWLYPLAEITVFSAIYIYMHCRHERMSRRFADNIINASRP